MNSRRRVALRCLRDTNVSGLKATSCVIIERYQTGAMTIEAEPSANRSSPHSAGRQRADHPSGLGAGDALDQCARDAGDDRLGLADLRCLAAVRLHFPRAIALGNWLGGALLWHFAAMWLLVVNGLVYVALGFATGRFRRKLLPIRPRDVVRDLVAALRGKLAHDDLSVYNAVQKLLYLGVIVAGVVIVLSGLSIWKPVQFQELTGLFGGYDTARYVHFFAMAAIVAFLVVHVTLGDPGAEEPARHDLRPLKDEEKTMATCQRKTVPGVDPKLLIKDAAKLLPEPSRRLFLRGAAEPRRARRAHRLRYRRRRHRRRTRCASISRFNDRVQALLFNPRHAGAGLSGKRDHAAVPVQRLLSARTKRPRSTATATARDRRPGRQQEAVDAAGAPQAAGGFADHAPCLRRGLERDRLLAGRAAVAISSS